MVGHPRYHELVKQMVEIHNNKNQDYADSKEDPLRNFRMSELAGIPAFDGALTRLSDKFIRVMNLRKKEKEGRMAAVAGELITDTLMDLANYALISLLLYEQAEQGWKPNPDNYDDYDDEREYRETRYKDVTTEPSAHMIERVKEDWTDKVQCP